VGPESPDNHLHTSARSLHPTAPRGRHLSLMQLREARHQGDARFVRRFLLVYSLQTRQESAHLTYRFPRQKINTCIACGPRRYPAIHLPDDLHLCVYCGCRLPRLRERVIQVGPRAADEHVQ